jgi:hypothetical protein
MGRTLAKAAQHQAFAGADEMVSAFLQSCASFEDQFHRPIIGQTQDAIGRFHPSSRPRELSRAASTEAPMDERRKAQRLRALKAGSISFNVRRHELPRAQYVACLRVPGSHDQFGLLDNFVLVISYDNSAGLATSSGV